MKKKKPKIDAATALTLFDQQDHFTTWTTLKQEYKKAIIVIRIGGTYFSYGNDAALIEKYTGIVKTGTSM
jgi:DNA mismatch repair ATPase MutS